jgi:hypothetical protein
MGDVRSDPLGEALHPARLQRVPWGQDERPDRAGGTGRVLHLVLDDLMPGAPQHLRLGADDGVLAARLPVRGVQL